MKEKKESQKKKRSMRSRFLRPFIVFFLPGAGLALLGIFLIPWALDYYTDGLSIYQASREATIRKVLWEEPRLLDEGINETLENYEPAFSADGGIMIFTRGKAKHNADLYMAGRRQGGWGEPSPLEIINSPLDELGPELSRDGQYLYFYSNRDGGFGGYDIWVSRWNGKEWTFPENLGARINSAFNEYGPGLSPEGDRIFFSSNRLRRERTHEEKEAWEATLRENLLESDYDIFSAFLDPRQTSKPGDALAPIPKFFEAKPVAVLNSPADEGQVALTPRGEFLYFSSNRRGGHGGFDIYRSRIFHGEFMEPENVGAPVNSLLDDMDPALILEGYGLAFSPNRIQRGDQRPFLIYQTVSREVMAQKDLSVLVALIRYLDRIKWPVFLFLLGILGLLFLLRFVMSSRFRMHASLLQKCLLASLLFHLLLGVLMSTWMITGSLYDLSGDHLGEMRLDMEALAGERLGLEIREQVADLEGVLDRLSFETPAETLTELPSADKTKLDSRIFEPAELSKAFVPGHPAHEKVFREDTSLFPLSQNVALEHLNVCEDQIKLETGQAAALKNNPKFVQVNDGLAAERALLDPEKSLPDSSLSNLPVQEPVLQNHASLFREAPSGNERKAPQDTPSPPLPGNWTLIPRTPKSPDRVMETPELRKEAANDESLGISDPLVVSRFEPVLPFEEGAAAMGAKPDLPLRDDVRKSGGSAVFRPSLNPLPESQPKLSLPRQLLSGGEQPEKARHSIVMEIPEAESAPEGKDPFTPSKSFSSKKAEKREEISNINIQRGSPLPFPETGDPQPLDRSLVDDERSGSRPSWDEKELVPAFKFEPLAEERSIDPRIEMEENPLGKAAPSKALPPVDSPRAEAERENEPLLPKESPLVPAEVDAKEAVKNLFEPVKPIPLSLELARMKTSPEASQEISRYEHDVPRVYHGLEMKSRRVVFCLDVSSSMEWNNRINDARQELLRLLDTLDDSVEFNIITFSGDVRVWSRYGVLPGTASNLDSAKRFVRNSRIGQDGTNTLKALSVALADEKVEGIYFLSDGHPTVGYTTDFETILELVAKLQENRKVAIHTIAYVKGNPPREWRSQVPPRGELIDFMKRLVEQNSGNFVLFE